MNRLIIIGNGFDLAHGLNTSYSGFLLDYLTNCLNKFFKSGIYEDSLIEIKVTDHYFRRFSDNPIATPDNVLDKINGIKNHRQLDFKTHSKLIQNTLLKLSELNWVDLEMEYFEILADINQRGSGPRKMEQVDLLNSQLDYLKSKLVEYLKTEQENTEYESSNDLLVGCFTQLIRNEEVLMHNIDDKENPNNILFLNFNYTDVILPYVKKSNKFIPSTYTYIHGDLDGNFGNPVFGFGDELNKKYLSFEEENNNSLFKHIKSFEYLQNKNYYELTRFIESDVFQVHIYGHSCGLSDRTLLNQIFEETNCKSIKIFYHEKEGGSTDFTEKTHEISRHFNDKILLRKKLVPFALSEAMPQPELK